MAKRELHAKALEMRFQGMSYGQIKRELGVGKGTLSAWLRKFPLPEERIRELRNKNDQKIERTRETKARKKEARNVLVREKAARDIGELSERELFIACLFLYWGEGNKSTRGTTGLSNTDPAMLRFFIQWLALLGIAKDGLKVKVHLYKDMNIESEMEFWSKELDIPLTSFRKPYIKTSNIKDITYFQRFTHGTCNILFEKRDMYEYVLASLSCLQERFAEQAVT